MTPDQAATIMQFLSPQLEQEYQVTRRVLAAVPDQHCEYAPHEVCMKAGKLAQHLAESDIWFLEGILKGEFATPGEKPPTMKPSEVLAMYDSKYPQLLQQLGNLSPEHLAKDTAFHMFNLPMVAYVQFAQKHAVHHRGQLSAYLRPMGAKVPSIYGGSADEPMTAASQP